VGQSSSTGAKKMKVALFTLYFAISVALLMLTFRIDEYLRNSTLSKTSTIISYFILAFLLSVIAAYLAPWVAHLLFPKLREGGWTEAIMIGGIIFLLLCMIGALFGPLGINFPGTRIRGIFFSEWKFINFILYNAIVLALLGGVLRRFAKR
jgi:uncharacterized membrane protein